MNVALLGKYFGWGGGVEFLRHVANGLLAKKDSNQLKIYLLLPVVNRIDAPIDLLRIIKRSLKGSIQKRRPWVARPYPEYHQSMLDFFVHTQGGKVETVLYANTNDGLMRCLDRLNADVALPVNGSLGKNFPIPWVAYIADFQHKYLPGNFDPAECFEREIHFATTLRDAKSLIVNSRSVKDDIARFYPWSNAENVFNLPFSPHPLEEWFVNDGVDVSKKYELPETYFLISNQFWIHKDHWVALKALKRVANQCDAVIVCTGNMYDYRRPGYLEEIKKYINEHALDNRVRLLGHIPKHDQIQIMKTARAVIQPTLFEGGPGGGSTYDAVSLGVPVILSDIQVNKEVVSDRVTFFSAGDDKALALKMLEVINAEYKPVPHDMLLERGKENLSRLGDRLLEAIAHARHV